LCRQASRLYRRAGRPLFLSALFALKFFNTLSVQSPEPRSVRGVIFARQPLRVMLAAAAADPLHQRAGLFCPLVFAAAEADSTVLTI